MVLTPDMPDLASVTDFWIAVRDTLNITRVCLNSAEYRFPSDLRRCGKTANNAEEIRCNCHSIEYYVVRVVGDYVLKKKKGKAPLGSEYVALCDSGILQM